MAEKPIIKNKSVLGELDVPLLRKFVEFGEEVEVEIEHAVNLLAQYANWDAVNDAAKAIVAQIRADEDARNAPPVTDAAPAAPATSTPVTPAVVIPPAVVPAPVATASAAPAPDATEATK